MWANANTLDLLANAYTAGRRRVPYTNGRSRPITRITIGRRPNHRQRSVHAQRTAVPESLRYQRSRNSGTTRVNRERSSMPPPSPGPAYGLRRGGWYHVHMARQGDPSGIREINPDTAVSGSASLNERGLVIVTPPSAPPAPQSVVMEYLGLSGSESPGAAPPSGEASEQ
jgi:hypothetical protein